MNKYIVSVNLQVEVEAFGKADAFEAVEDVFGVGDSCGLNVVEFDVLESVEQN
jgi:hypothetical protein